MWAGALSAWSCRSKDALRGWGVTPIDIDNDGWIDLAAIVETKAGPRVRVLRNRGDGSFEDVSHALGLDSVAAARAARADCRRCGWRRRGGSDRDAAECAAGAAAQRGREQESLCAPRSDRALPTTRRRLGAKVEIFANGHWQKWELAGASGYQTQAPPQILVGLGDAPRHRSAAHSVADGRVAGRDRFAAARR